MRCFASTCLVLLAAMLLGACANSHHATQRSDQGHRQSAPPTSTFSPPGAQFVYSVTPVIRSRPTYPPRAAQRRLGGCAKVYFHLDARGRPNRLSVFPGEPPGVFNRAVMRAVAHWRFRVTDSEGHPVEAPAFMRVVQVINFSIGDPRTPISVSRAHWLCAQWMPYALIVTRAPATASEAVRIHPAQDKPVDKPVTWASLAVTPGTALPKGWVKLRFCVGPAAQVTDARVVDSKPKGLYDAAALAALKSWKLNAPEWNGKKAEICNIPKYLAVYGADFLAHSPAALYRRPTALRRDEFGLDRSDLPRSGRVTLSYCIDPDGAVEDPQIVQSKPSGVFDTAAKQVLRSWSYWPRMADGEPVATCHVKTTIKFQSRDGELVWASPAS